MFVPERLAALLGKLHDADCGPIRQAGDELRCRCPAHDDHGPSLYVNQTADRILIRCGAGCNARAICDRLDHDQADLFFSPDEPMVEMTADVVGTGVQTAVSTPSSATTSAEDQLDQRHAVYSALLDRLELSTSHFDDLRRRGLTSEQITTNGYKSADTAMIRRAVDALLSTFSRAILLAVPGFMERDGRIIFGASRGILIPVRDHRGHIAAIKIRHDDGHPGAKYTWASSRHQSCGNPVHVPIGIPIPSMVVRVTEGELKADIATTLSGMPTISAPGVGNWASVIPVLRQLGAQNVRVAFDRDGKPGTLAAMRNAIMGLAREQFDVVVESWDSAVGKGIDDVLAAGGQVEVVNGLLALARLENEMSPPDANREVEPEPEPPPFPVDEFPPGLATYCRQVAEATSTPPDFCAVAMLVTAGAAIGNSRALCLKDNVWFESPRFYAANVGDPASGKTPAMDAVVRPYQAMQSRRLREYKDAKDSYDQARHEYDRIAKENRNLPESDRRPLPPLPDEPAKPDRFLVMDATVESLAPLLEENPRGLLMPQDEGVAWVRGMGQYKGGRGNDRQFWPSTWSGKTHLVDRKSQEGVPISIPRPFVNVVCGLPPDMLSELADFQGRNDGFLHRVLFCFPRASTGADWSDVTVTSESRETWERTLASLRRLDMQELTDGAQGYQDVRFTAAARQAWIAWWNCHAAEMRDPNLPIQLLGPWGKLKAYAARFALVLHFLWLVQGDGDEGDIDESSMSRAIRVVDYFKAHARVVYARLRHTPEDNRLLEVLEWIRQRGGQCRARDLANAKKVTPTSKAKLMLNEMEERGYGRVEPRLASNGKKVLWFVLDPG